MSDTEQVQSFSPLIILIWVLNIIIVAMDYSPDQTITWSIPIVGSVIVIQIYMIWKTNYDQMVQEQREVEAKKLGGSIVKDTPLIQPGVTNLADANKKGGAMVNLTLSPSVLDDEE